MLVTRYAHPPSTYLNHSHTITPNGTLKCTRHWPPHFATIIEEGTPICPDCLAMLNPKHPPPESVIRRPGRPKDKSKPQPLPNDWPTIKEPVLVRDNYHCQACNSTTTLQVHHIDHDRSNNTPPNLITLCIPCHLKLHHIQKGAHGKPPKGPNNGFKETTLPPTNPKCFTLRKTAT